MTPPGAPPPVLWTAKGAALGAEPAPLGWVDRTAGALFMALWWTLGLLAWPIALCHPRARRHALGLPTPEPGWTWLHGASAGEHEAARALAPLMDEGAWRTSSSWRTPVSGAFPAPLDLPFLVGRWLDRARPGRLVLVEAELWPGWLRACRVRGIPVAVVNARPSKGTARWRKLGPVWRWMTAGVRFIDQSDTGDLKLDAAVRAATVDLGRDAFIAASTRPGDEVRLLNAWALLPAQIARRPRPLLVLAPRHLKRLPGVIDALNASGLQWSQRTIAAPISTDDVLLLDTIGELGGLFGQARAAFVGGTFDPAIGGHSPAEPFRAGVPVVHGPCTTANPTAWAQGIALRVGQAPDPAALAKAIQAALSVGPRAAHQGEAAVRAMSALPPPNTPPERPHRPWLAPLVRPYRAIARRHRGYAADPTAIDIPVISVGALSAGGTGKTPTVAWLAQRLPGAWVVSRGYRRGAQGPDVRVGLPGAVPEHPLGDELEMLRRRGTPVVSAPDRVAGAREAQTRGATLVLLDDGFGHRALTRDVDIICVDARHPDGGGPIPVGSRREPWSALTRAHWLWLNHTRRFTDDAPLPPQADAMPIVRARLEPRHWLHKGQTLPLNALTGPIDVAVGVARPEGVMCTLLRMGLDIRSTRVVRDHADLGALPPGCVVTEKDAARLPADADVYALICELRVVGADPLLGAIRDLIQ